MIKKLTFTDETRKQIIADQAKQGFRLFEEQRHIDGNHLLFTDEPPVRDLAVEIDDLNARLKELERLKVVR